MRNVDAACVYIGPGRPRAPEILCNLSSDIICFDVVSVFSKGQCETVAYRFLGKRGGYAWVVTQATLIHCTKQQKPLSVVCVNYILR